MKKSERKLETHRRIPVIRSASSVISNVLIDKPVAAKKALNIPICDVTNDKDYDKEVSADFQLPPSYVKHIKKIGDEVDASLDYVIDKDDEQWIKGLSSLGVPKDIQRLLNHNTFEFIFDTLERYTGFSKDPIPQINASRIISDELRWGESADLKLLPALYEYWLSKRGRANKPLCRRYWPQTLSVDSNPHQVFRARDKEKYRLRRQQKRNDIDAFRKMQKLRREFMEARVLVNLILERELLREAEFRIQREVFDQQMHDALLDGTGTGTGGTGGNVKSGIAGAGAGVGVGVGLGVGVGVGAHVPSPQGVQAPSSSSGRRQEVPYRHSLQFPHLLYPPVAKSDKLGDKKLALKSGKDLKKNGKNPGAAPVGRPKLLPGAKAARKAAALAVAEASLEAAKCEVDGNGLKRRKNDDGKKRKRDRDGLGAVMNMEACRDEKTGVDEVRGGALEEVYTAQYRTIHADLDGPSEICQPPWPSFMEQADYREEAAVRSVGEYIDALEYRYDAENRPILPTKYRARCRVGRGGRLVVDRIPLYDDPVEREELDEYETPETQTQTVDAPAPVYIYPSSLSYRYPRNAYQTHYGPPGGPGTGAGPGRKPNPANAAANAAAAAAAGYGPALSPSQGTPLNSQLPGMPLSNARLVSQALRPHGNANTKHILNPAVRAMRIASIPKIPPFAPPARPAVHNSKLARLSAILSLGDAEEERVAIPRYLPGEGVSNASKSSAVELSRVKYVTRL